MCSPLYCCSAPRIFDVRRYTQSLRSAVRVRRPSGVRSAAATEEMVRPPVVVVVVVQSNSPAGGVVVVVCRRRSLLGRGEGGDVDHPGIAARGTLAHTFEGTFAQRAHGGLQSPRPDAGKAKLMVAANHVCGLPGLAEADRTCFDTSFWCSKKTKERRIGGTGQATQLGGALGSREKTQSNGDTILWTKRCIYLPSITKCYWRREPIQVKTKQHKTTQDKTKQHQTTQDNTRKYKITQDSTRKHKRRKNETRQDNNV